ncbi:hypothetical protein Y032_0006g2865 [Ancylostoma ceylanicum]|uniref:Uncharacterized protein n=1 Tax=Ancylostoma ceylanicum TaxID=53326 RepID=A0A016VNS4_9BILA|nr:hypothetical protein Y032_0006g2865 [Ancylostoma ceylanicum]
MSSVWRPCSLDLSLSGDHLLLSMRPSLAEKKFKSEPEPEFGKAAILPRDSADSSKEALVFCSKGGEGPSISMVHTTRTEVLYRRF